MAAEIDRMDIVKHLVHNGADINIQDNNGVNYINDNRYSLLSKSNFQGGNRITETSL